MLKKIVKTSIICILSLPILSCSLISAKANYHGPHHLAKAYHMKNHHEFKAKYRYPKHNYRPHHHGSYHHGSYHHGLYHHGSYHHGSYHHGLYHHGLYHHGSHR